MSGLSDYLNSLNIEGWSLRRIAQEAERHGHRINYTTVRKYINGTHGAPSADALAALAAAFRVDVNDMRVAARRPSVGEPLDLGAEGARLTGPQREAIRTTVRLFVEQNDALARDAESHGPTSAGASDTDIGQKVHHLDRSDTKADSYPWEQPDFDFAAKRGRNRGREAREQQDRDAEDGGA